MYMQLNWEGLAAVDYAYQNSICRVKGCNVIIARVAAEPGDEARFRVQMLVSVPCHLLSCVYCHYNPATQLQRT